MTDDHARHSSVLPPVDERGLRAGESRDLANAFRQGEAWASARLIERATPRVVQLVRRLLAWPADVDDVVHDVFVAALVARKTFRGDAKFETWITRIAINRCRAHRRRRWLRQKLLSAWREQQPPQDAGDASDRVAFDEQVAHVRQAVAELPQAYREVVVLFYLEQMSSAEVAKVLGLRTNTVDKRLSRARQRLAERLADETH